MTMPKLSVSEFNQTVNHVLGQIGEVVVEGEISELKLSQGKWVFGTLKDTEATVDLFGSVFQIKNLGSLAVGMQVTVYGVPRLYEKTGRFSISINQIIPSGLGALQVAFEKLRQQLEKEGLFAPERKRKLPVFPTRIGLVTAKGSQAYADFVKVVGERMGGLNIYFCPVQVQGQGSIQSVINAIGFLNAAQLDLDLLVLTRGGGSLEDLASFNDEQVVRAVFSSKVPVVCAVGHEENVSLAELAADLRASTPSNAAELVVKDRKDILRQVELQKRLVGRGLAQLVHTYKVRGVHASSKIESHLGYLMQEVTRTIGLFYTQTLNWIRKYKDKVGYLTTRLDGLDYQSILARVFSMTTNDTGEIVRSVAQVVIQSEIRTLLSDGKIISRVLESRHE